MNVQTRLSAKGQVVIPKDVRDALGLKAGMRLNVSTHHGSITLKPVDWHNPFPRTTIEDIRAIPRWIEKPKTVEEISGLSDEDIVFVLDERGRNAGDDPAQAEIAEGVVGSPFIILPTVLMETARVLRAKFKLSRTDVASRLGHLLGIEHARIVSPDAIEWAMAQAMRGHDFADALHLALADDAGATTFTTFDQRIGRITDIALPVEILPEKR